MEQIDHPTQQNSLGLNNSTRKRVRKRSRKLPVYLILFVFGFLLGTFCKAEAAVVVDNLKASANMEYLHTIVSQDIHLDNATASSKTGKDGESSEKTVQTDSKSDQQSISIETKSDTAQKVDPKNTNGVSTDKVIADGNQTIISEQDKQPEQDLIANDPVNAAKLKMEKEKGYKPTFVAEDLKEKVEGNYNPDNQNGKITQAQYKINVNLKDQCVTIYNNGELVKEFTVSTGTDNSTPTGDFEIQNRGEWFFSEKYQEGAKWWVSFKGWGEYLFHSVAMNGNKQIIQEEADKLGSPASHGCIRLPVDDAKWIYDNIPQGTTVHIG